MIKQRSAVLDDVGDLSALPGSRAWAVAVRLQLQGVLKDNESSVEHLEVWFRGMAEHEGYRQLANEWGEPFPTFETFCRERQPYGLGYDLKIINAIISERKLVQAKAKDRARDAAGESVGEVLPSDGSIHPGNAAQFAQHTQVKRATANGVSRRTQQKIDRLPNGLRSRVAAGELSVNAAAIEAGIVKPTLTITVPVPVDPAQIARALCKRLSHDEWLRLKAEGDRQFGGA